MKPRRILYVQHAGSLGGSAMSLLYTIAALDRSVWDPVVALIRPSPELSALYAGAGIEVVAWTGIETFEHTTAYRMVPWRPRDWLLAGRLAAGMARSARRMRELVARVKPDIVHLNSVVLLPAARGLAQGTVPWVWHVREAPVRGLLGRRRRAIARALSEWPDQAVFISEADRSAWLGDSATGTVVHNFVDLAHFHPNTGDARAALGIAPDAPVITFLGGISEIKGILPLLEALALLRDEMPGLKCLMPGSLYEQRSDWMARSARRVLPLLGLGTWSQRVRREIESRGLQNVCVLLPFQADVRPHLAAADVVVFPALEPHFPRPAVEAAAMGKPVVASRLAGVDEIVVDGRTGLLTTAGDAHALATALQRVLRDRRYAAELGKRGRALAVERFDASRQIDRITGIYERLLAPARATDPARATRRS